MLQLWTMCLWCMVFIYLFFLGVCVSPQMNKFRILTKLFIYIIKQIHDLGNSVILLIKLKKNLQLHIVYYFHFQALIVVEKVPERLKWIWNAVQLIRSIRSMMEQKRADQRAQVSFTIDFFFSKKVGPYFLADGVTKWMSSLYWKDSLVIS